MLILFFEFRSYTKVYNHVSIGYARARARYTPSKLDCQVCLCYPLGVALIEASTQSGTTLLEKPKRTPGPLFNPFETLTPALIREKSEAIHFLTTPSETDVYVPDDISEMHFDFYPSPVDLPYFSVHKTKVTAIIKEKMQKKLAVAEASAQYDLIKQEGRKIMANEFNTNDEFDANQYQNMNDDEIPASVWVPDRALQAIEMERQFEEGISDTALAQKILKQNLPLVAVGITHTAKYASDQRLRFQAQTYVMDRVLGKVGTSVVNDDSPLDELNKQLLELVSAAMAEEA